MRQRNHVPTERATRAPESREVAVKSVDQAVTVPSVRAESVASTRSKNDRDTRGPAERRSANTPEGPLRDALQANDGQVAASVVPLHEQLDLGSGLAPGERRRLRARGSSRPSPRRSNRGSWIATNATPPKSLICFPAPRGATLLSAREVLPAERLSFRNPSHPAGGSK